MKRLFLLSILLTTAQAHAVFGDKTEATAIAAQGQIQGQAQKATADANAGAAAGAISSNRNKVSNHSANLNANKNNLQNHSANVGINANKATGGNARASGGDSYAKGGAGGTALSGSIAKGGNQSLVNRNAANAQTGEIDNNSVATTGAVTTTDTTTVQGDEISIAGDTVNQSYKEAASSAIAGYGNTTASCFRTLGLGGSTTSTGWSAGIPLKDRDCEMGEDAAQAFMAGNYGAYGRLFCAQKNVKKVYGAKWMNRDSHTAAVQECRDETADAITASNQAAGDKEMLNQLAGDVAVLRAQMERDEIARRKAEHMGQAFRKDVQDLSVTK